MNNKIYIIVNSLLKHNIVKLCHQYFMNSSIEIDVSMLEINKKGNSLIFIDEKYLEEIEINKFENSLNPGIYLIILVGDKTKYHHILSFNPFYILRKDNLKNDFNTLLYLLQERNDFFVNLVLIEYRGIEHILNIHLIYYIESNKHYVYIHLSDIEIKKKIKLSDFKEKYLGRYFMRIHVSYIVNFFYIDKVDGDKVLLKNGYQLPISRKYKQEFIKLYFQYKTFS